MLINNNCGTLGYLVFHQILGPSANYMQETAGTFKKILDFISGISSLRFFAFRPVRDEMTVISAPCGFS